MKKQDLYRYCKHSYGVTRLMTAQCKSSYQTYFMKFINRKFLIEFVTTFEFYRISCLAIKAWLFGCPTLYRYNESTEGFSVGLNWPDSGSYFVGYLFFQRIYLFHGQRGR